MPKLMPTAVGLGVGFISGMLRKSDAANAATRNTLMKQQGSLFDFGIPLAVVVMEMAGIGRFNSEMTDSAYYAGLGLSGERLSRSQGTGHFGNPVPNMMGTYGQMPMVASGMRAAAPAVLRQATGTLR